MDTVCTVRCAGYGAEGVLRALRELLSPLGGMQAFVRPGTRVLLKPNFVAGRPADVAANTHPDVIIAVARLVRECGGEPFVADSPALGSAESVAAKSGLLEQARAMNLPIRTLSEGRWVKAAGGPVKRFKISQDVLDCDVVINMPKLKGHRQMVYTGAVKNLFGCVPGRRKAWMHLCSKDDRMWFARMLLQCYDEVKPALTIMDAIVGMEGPGPLSGEARQVGALLAGTDCVAIDRVACDIINLPWREVPTLLAAEEMQLGETNIFEIKVEGPTTDELKVSDFKIPTLSPISFSPYRVVRGLVRNWWLMRRGLVG